MASFGIRQSIKLTSKYYGPFRVLQKIGLLAYKLLLPEGVGIHPVFHVSQLKQHLGPRAVPEPGLPLVGKDGKIRTEPLQVLETRSLPRNKTLIMQWLIEWHNLPATDASWEDATFIKRVFPDFFSNTVKSWQETEPDSSQTTT
jgi:hypothetical protein